MTRMDFIYRILTLAGRAARRYPPLRPAARAAYALLRPGAGWGRLPSPAEAAELLHGVSPDPQGSALGDNDVLPPRCDVQVILPVYNAAPFLRACLESVLTPPVRCTFRLVAVDDGSTDGSGAILADYARDPRLTVITQPNGGHAAARNAGLREITARYVFFLDADDTLPPGALDALVDAAERTDADIVEGGYDCVRSDGKVVSRHPKADCEDAVVTDLTGYTCMKLFRAALFRHVRFPLGYWYEDTVLSMLVFPLARRMATVSACVYRYTLNPAGITVSSVGSPKTLDSFYVVRRLLADAERLGVLKWTPVQRAQIFVEVIHAYHHTYLLGPVVRRALFVVTAGLVRTLPFPPSCRLHRALLSGDYAAYERCCLFDDAG